MDRRTLFRWMLKVGSAVVAAIVGIPALISAMSPAWARRRPEVWRPVGRLESFAAGGIRGAEVAASDGDTWPPPLRPVGVYVRRSSDGVIVFSRRCTDLGCPVTFDPGSACFYCPCHGGIFTADGQRLAGPPDRPLDRYAVRVRDGTIEIDLGSVPPMS